MGLALSVHQIYAKSGRKLAPAARAVGVPE
jgi:hypothetical protein